MKRIKASSFEDLIARYNPFGFKHEDGSSMAFDNYGEVYGYTLRSLTAQFPRGYIDIILYLHRQTQMPLTDCKATARGFRSLGLEAGIKLIEYWNPMTNPKFEFEQIMKALHTLSETKFDGNYFNDAWHKFQAEMEVTRRQARVESGDIVGFANH